MGPCKPLSLTGRPACSQTPHLPIFLGSSPLGVAARSNWLPEPTLPQLGVRRLQLRRSKLAARSPIPASARNWPVNELAARASFGIGGTLTFAALDRSAPLGRWSWQLEPARPRFGARPHRAEQKRAEPRNTKRNIHELCASKAGRYTTLSEYIYIYINK